MEDSAPAAATLKHAAGDCLNGTAQNGGDHAFEILEALLAFHSGSFSVRLPTHWTGVDGKIADAFNEMLAMSKRRAEETARVCRVVGQEGKLKQRLRVPGLIGEWADEIDALNSLMDDLVWPAKEVTRTIGAVAKGDLGQSMALAVDGRPLRGEFLHAAQLVNRMIDQLSVFTLEVTRVAREMGTESKLGGQAQVRDVSGVWKDLTESVNQMAGSLTAQVRHIVDVTTAVANGDLSQKITVDARGEILQLKEAINTMVDQLRSFASETGGGDVSHEISVDVAERKRAEAALRAANTELAAKNAELERQAGDRERRVRAEAAKEEAEAARERSAFLAEASNLLAASFDSRETFDALAQLLVPKFGDCCLVDFVEEDGSLRSVVVVHEDPVLQERITAFRVAFPMRLDDGRGVGPALRAGVPLICPSFGEKEIAAFTRDTGEAREIEKLEVRSYMILPLTARGRTLGALYVGSATVNHYGERDLPQARELAERAGLALDNARLYAEARQAREAAESANAAKDRFLAMLSHELRTPLSPVLHAVALVEEEACPPAVREMLETIRRNVQLEARLIDDLLDLARIRNGKLQLQLEIVDAHDLLRRAAKICEPDIASHHLQITFDFRAARFQLHADSARVQQIFWNLISNAIKYTPPGGTIVLRTRNEEDTLLVEVADSGIGIEPDRIDRIFDAFEQAHGSRSSGLGLGLAICRALTLLHGGRIDVRSEGAGRGTTFCVALPASVGLPALPLAAPLALPTAPAVKLRLLVVEDHADTAATLERLLVRRGYIVRSAATMAQARQLMNEVVFDVLVSDIGLPDGSGLDLMPSFAETAGARAIGGIALSGFGMPEDIERSKAAGFTEHLTKPVDISLLHKALIGVGRELAPL